MKRREVVALLSAAVAWPLAARALASRRLGILMQTSAAAAEARGFLDAFVQALKEAGWIEGQNIVFERRFADGKNDLLQKLAAELAQLRIDAILTDSTPSSRAVKNATPTHTNRHGGK